MSGGHANAAAIVAAVRGCVGTAFRPQGRRPGVGLDCVGVALVALAAAAGPRGVPAVPAYSLRGDRLEAPLRAWLAAAGCARWTAGAMAGDLIVALLAPGRPHLAVATPAGAVHAALALRRVVEGPLDPAWGRLDIWRLPPNGGV